MASRKRGASFVSGGVLVDSLWDITNRDQTLHKRTCGSQSHPAPSQLSDSQVAAFINRLSPQLNSCSNVLFAHSGLNAAGWQAFAELNTVLGQHFHTLASCQLRGYHSFVTQDRVNLWLSYARQKGVSQEAATAAAPHSYQPRYLQLVRCMLEYVLAAYPQASITEYTLRIPPWMVGWAARWGWSCSNVEVLVLQAYSPVDPACSRTSSNRQPALKLFVPMLL